MDKSNEFLIDHGNSHNTMADLMTDDGSSSSANNNHLLLLDDNTSSAAVGGGILPSTTIVDEPHNIKLPVDDEQLNFQQTQSQSSSSSLLLDNEQQKEQQPQPNDDIAHQHSSSADDFEFIATPQTDRDVKMDNLLDFEYSAPAPKAGANLVETLLTAEDLQPAIKDELNKGAAYLENEFTQFSTGLKEPSQEFLNLGGKPVKDVYNDFMEAERGGRVVDFIRDSPEPEQPKPAMPVVTGKFELPVEEPIETISSTPVVPPIHPSTHHADDYYGRTLADDDDDEAGDLLEQFSAKEAEVPVDNKPIAVTAPPPVIEEKQPVAAVQPPPVVEKPREEPIVPVPVEQPKKAEEEKPKPKEVPKPAVAPPAAVQKKPAKDELITTSAEEMFCKVGLDAWFKPERLHPKVESLIYWRDVKKSGIVCGAGLLILLAMSCFSVISVFAYVSLLALAGTVSIRIYKSVMQAIQKTSDGHPFKAFLDFELQLPQEKVQQVTGVAVSHINSVLAELRRLFLVEDLIDSVKFGVMLWCLTYVGAWFNGMTLVILSYVALFTLPKVYETNKASIDAYLDLVRSKINEITEKVKAAIPIGKKAESDKDK